MIEWNLTEAQKQALVRIVEDWIGEGFTTNPYPDAYYDIFESLELEGWHLYDIERP